MREGNLWKTVVTATPCNTLQHASKHTTTHCNALHSKTRGEDPERLLSNLDSIHGVSYEMER